MKLICYVSRAATLGDTRASRGTKARGRLEVLACRRSEKYMLRLLILCRCCVQIYRVHVSQGTIPREYGFETRAGVSNGLQEGREEEKEKMEQESEEEEEEEWQEDAKLLDVRVQHPQGNSPAGYELTVDSPAGVLGEGHNSLCPNGRL